MHPTRGPVSPATFVPVAEDIGLIGPIGDWVFCQALDDLTRWQEAVDAPVQVGINMSALQLRGADSGVANWVRLMKERGIPAAHIVVEITESSLMEERESVSMRLAELRDAGVQLSLDDFGTGYSSLAYLKRFPIDFLKIDQTFVRALGRGSSDLAMCEAIIAMAHKMNIRVVAEGVETGEQLEILRNAGCDFAQGFLFSRPVPRDELEVLLEADKVWIGDAPPATGDDRMTEDLQHRVDTPVRLARVEARRQRFAQS